jgi:hypothetical protein
MLELIQAREDVLRKAQLEMQGQVNLLVHQVREMAEVDELSKVDWQPTSTIIIPDFEKIIEEKVDQRLYHRRLSRGVPPPIRWGERRRKEEVCWNLLHVPTVILPDRHRRTSHDYPPREEVILPRWPTRIYKSSVRAKQHLPQLCKRQGQEGDRLGENWLRRLLEVQGGWLLPSHHPLHRRGVILHHKKKELYLHRQALPCLLQVA